MARATDTVTGAEVELEAGRLRVELAVDAAQIGSFDWDLTTGRLSWDDRLLQIFGYDRDSFDESIDSFLARCHPEDRLRTLESLQSAVDTCGDFSAEYRVVLPTGELRWVQGRGRALADESGVAVRLLGVAYDTTAQQEGEARVVRVLEAMNAAFFALDRQWRFTYVNAEAERVLHASREELVGGEIWDLFPAAVGSNFEENYRGAMADGTERVFEAYYPAPLDAWYEVRAWPSPDGLSVYFLDVTDRLAAEERSRRQRRPPRAGRRGHLRHVRRADRRSGGGDGPPTGGRGGGARARRLGHPQPGRRGRPHARRRQLAPRPGGPAARRAVRRPAAGRRSGPTPRSSGRWPPASCSPSTTSGETVGRSLPPGEVSDVFRALAPRSAITLPLAARGRTVGALSAYRSADRPPADADDVATAREVAGRVALALDNARLYEQQRRLAEGLQRSLLTAPPEPDHAEIVVRYRPAMEVAQVGGDWYDAFLQPPGSTMVVIGDVVGHDTEAAAAMGQLRGMLRGIAYRAGLGPAAVLTDLDAAIEGLGMGTMATAAIARVEATAEERVAGIARLRWSNAGHPPPLLLHPDGSVEELSGAASELMLGVDPTVPRTDSVVSVRRGATLLLYTDGLVEGRDLPLDDGIARLREALAELADRPLAELCDEVIDRLRPEGLQDDVALVAVRLHPEDRPRPREAGPQRVPAAFR